MLPSQSEANPISALEAVVTVAVFQVCRVITLNYVMQGRVLLEVPALLTPIGIKTEVHHSPTGRAHLKLVGFLVGTPVHHTGKYIRLARGLKNFPKHGPFSYAQSALFT